MPRKVCDVSRLTAMGWKARIGVREGVEATYAWLLDNETHARGLDLTAMAMA
jgi:GDP-L-fucose synthase